VEGGAPESTFSEKNHQRDSRRRRSGAGCRGGGFGNGLKGLRAGAYNGRKAPSPKRGLTSAKYWIYAKRKVNRREEEGNKP
jgi:hypothetical protein